MGQVAAMGTSEILPHVSPSLTYPRYGLLDNGDLIRLSVWENWGHLTLPLFLSWVGVMGMEQREKNQIYRGEARH